MPVKFGGTVYYRTTEACQRIGISRATFHRWLKEGTIEGPSAKDRNGWRLFTTQEVAQIRAEAKRVTHPLSKGKRSSKEMKII